MKFFHCCIAVFACCSLLLTSCGKSNPTSAPATPTQPAAARKPKELIVAKWQRADPGKESEKLEFAADGTISSESGGFKSNGKYKWIEDDAVIEYEMKPDLGNLQYAKCKVTVSKDELTLDIVDAKSRPNESAKWQHEADDKARIGVEKYKRLP